MGCGELIVGEAVGLVGLVVVICGDVRGRKMVANLLSVEPVVAVTDDKIDD